MQTERQTTTAGGKPGAARWWLRLLLAAALFTGSEVLLWTNLTGRSLTEWLLLIPGYVALAVVLLDWLARHRVRDLPGLMTLAGLYGLLNALLLNPDTTLFDVPRTLVTRVTGAHTLLGLEMLALVLALTGGQRRDLRRVLLVGAAAVGLAWGTWVRWSPGQSGVAFAPVSLEGMLLAGALAVLLLAGLTRQVYHTGKALTPPDLLLTTREQALTVLLLALIGLIRLAQGALDVPSLFVVGILLLLTWAMLWFRRGTKLTTIVEQHVPVRPLPGLWIAVAVAILFWTGTLAYGLPQIGTTSFDQLTFVVYGFTLYGLAWLPTVSLWIGGRAYIRQVQARPL